MHPFELRAASAFIEGVTQPDIGDRARRGIDIIAIQNDFGWRYIVEVIGMARIGAGCGNVEAVTERRGKFELNARVIGTPVGDIESVGVAEVVVPLFHVEEIGLIGDAGDAAASAKLDAVQLFRLRLARHLQSLQTVEIGRLRRTGAARKIYIGGESVVELVQETDLRREVAEFIDAIGSAQVAPENTGGRMVLIVVARVLEAQARGKKRGGRQAPFAVDIWCEHQRFHRVIVVDTLRRQVRREAGCRVVLDFGQPAVRVFGVEAEHDAVPAVERGDKA